MDSREEKIKETYCECGPPQADYEVSIDFPGQDTSLCFVNYMNKGFCYTSMWILYIRYNLN